MSNQVGGRLPVVVTSSAQWHAIPRARGGPEAMDDRRPDEGHAINMVIPRYGHGQRCRMVKPGDALPCRLTNEIIG